MSLLILGGTGTLGRQIVRKALDEGFQVKCLVRNFRRASFLKEWGAELVYGDLKVPETIPLTLIGVTAIVDVSTTKTSDLYNTSQVDLHGKVTLIKAAAKACIRKYIFFSILKADQYPEIPLMWFKLKIENQLVNSSLNYTIFRLSGFFQGIINQYALPILENKSIWLTGDDTSIAYMDTQDIAKLTIKSLSMNQIRKKNLPLVGKYAWTSKSIIELCEKLSGQRCKIIRIPILFLKFAQQFTQFFQWTWNISDRLSFAGILVAGYNFSVSMEHVYELLYFNNDTISELPSYLEEYFTKVMKKLKELNFNIVNNSDTQNF